MKIVTNEGLIKRNKKIGNYLTLGSLAVLGIGLYISFQPDYLNWAYVALIIGFATSQFGIYYTNRWGRPPRPDEKITAALKGLENSYTLYHYMTPASHLLVGPAGIWVLIPLYQGGTITYEGGRWKQKGGNLWKKWFAQEGLGRPERELRFALEDWKKYQSKKYPDLNLPEAQGALVFTNPQSVIQVSDAPAPALKAEKLKDFIRQVTREAAKTIDQENIKALQERLPKS